MYKTKLFPIYKITEPEGNNEINLWLEQNVDITIISTNSFANVSGWGYIILYKESDVGSDADEVD